jgi:hypothetical protein
MGVRSGIGILEEGYTCNYLKKTYVDLRLDSVTDKNPWQIIVTGDAARMSQRGHNITVCGIKICDKRHSAQNGTNKDMSQAPALYTPTICAVGGEKNAMELFKGMVVELALIERQGFVRVNDKEYKLHIKVGIVGDKSFM